MKFKMNLIALLSSEKGQTVLKLTTLALAFAGVVGVGTNDNPSLPILG